MQDEAKQNGTLSIWSEFSWWPPWYRLHVVFKLSENSTVDVGFSPLLPCFPTLSLSKSASEWLASLLTQITEEIWQDTTVDLIALFASYVTAKGLFLWNQIGGTVAIVIKGVAQYVLFCLALCDEKAGSTVMLSSYIANLIMGLVAIAASVADTFLRAIWYSLTAPMMSAIMLTMNGMITVATPLEPIRTPIDYFESCVIDFPIAFLSFARFLGLI